MGWDRLFKRDQFKDKVAIITANHSRGLPIGNSRSKEVAQRARQKQADRELRQLTEDVFSEKE